MTKFNPTKIQRRMIKKIFSHIKKGKKDFKEYKFTGEEWAYEEFNKARGIANFMLSEAKTTRETIVAERVFYIAWGVGVSRVSNLPCPIRIRLENKRIARYEQRKARELSVFSHAAKAGV